jgi:hypothetical protein
VAAVINMSAFFDEMGKIAAAGSIPFSSKLTKQLASRMGKSFRSGTRSQKVTTLLERHKHGTHKHKLGEYNPTMGNAMATQPEQKELAAQKPKKAGDVPSRDDLPNGAKNYDQRDNATTIYGQGSQLNNIGALNYPSEHGL